MASVFAGNPVFANGRDWSKDWPPSDYIKYKKPKKRKDTVESGTSSKTCSTKSFPLKKSSAAASSATSQVTHSPGENSA